MRLDHIAYRVKDRKAAVAFFCDMFGYSVQTEFEICLEDGSTAMCSALEPPERAELGLEAPAFVADGYHLAPEVFVSDGPEGSVIAEWVKHWGRGQGAVHHMAYMVESVQETMQAWQAKGYAFTTQAPLECEDLVQVFTQPNPVTGIIYEFIERRGQHGFCKDNVADLMHSTRHLSQGATPQG
jgi:catechol 2,3-dioxygenase-like lactoylglutathione lyase family enzyme